MIELRPYQQEAVKQVISEWDAGHLRTLLVIPTGGGKTVIFSKITESETRNGRRVLILAHRAELLDQAADKLHRTVHLKAAKEKAEESALGSWYRVTIGSVQSLCRPKRLEKFDPAYYDTIIIDEAHHALSSSYQAILNHFNGARVLGVTATPERGDHKNLGEFFESIAYEYSLPQAINEGYLCKIKAQTIPLRLDISGVAMQNGDYAAGALGSVLDPYLDQIAEEMKVYCKGRKTVVFLPLVATSQKFVSILKAKGLNAEEVNGESPDRIEKLQAFDRGDFDILCNAMLLTEGWDCPSVDCIIVLRPTKVRSLYTQMLGRGFRLSPGKKDLLILDFLWMTERLDLCRPACLICKDELVAKKMTEALEESGEAVDLEEAEAQGEKDAIAEREQKLAEELRAMRRRKAKLVDPLQYAISVQNAEIVGWQPDLGDKPISDKQIENLEKMGIFAGELKSAMEADLILKSLMDRRSMGLATPKQIRFLEQRGFQHVGTWEFEAANKLISRISMNNWKIPYDINPATYEPPRVEKAEGEWW